MKSVEAIAQALIQLGVPSDQVDIEVLEEGSKGILGLFGKMTRIRATLKEDSEEEIYNDLAAIRETISEIKEEKTEPVQEVVKPEPEVQPEPQPVQEAAEEEIKAPTVDVEKKAALFLTDDNVLEIDVEDSAEESSMGVIIGKRGNTLDSLQYLTTMVVNKDTTEHIRVKLDTENYRARRQDTLEKLARSLARKVRKTGHKVVLEPMNPYERRIIHYTLQNDPAVETHSEGEEPYRKVVITPKRGRR